MIKVEVNWAGLLFVRRIDFFLCIFLISLIFFSLIFPLKTHSSSSYSHDSSSLTVTFSSVDDFSSCNNPTQWQINVGYGDPTSQEQSSIANISESTSITSNFDNGIQSGTKIKFIEAWVDDSVNGQCYIEIANKSSGLFNWGTSGSSTDTTPTPTPIVTTKIVTPTPTPTPIPDTTPPLVKINTNFSLPFETAPSITGSVYDASGISKIDYSVDNGKSWIPIRFDNVGDINIRFDIKPEGLEEDNYKVRFRAYDTKSNIGYSKTFDLVIDRLPPQIGGAMFFIGPQIIFPGGNGSLSILSGIEHSIVFSAIGGPIKMELFSKDKKFGVSKDKQSGLWTAKIKFEKAGKYSLMVKAEDGAGKKSEKKIADVNVVNPGSVSDIKTKEPLDKAKITVYLLHPKSKRWVVWDGKQYLQQNPTFSDKNGQFGLYLPAGKYYISISKAGYITSVSEFFSLENATILSLAISLTPKQKINIGPVSLYLPDFFFRNNYFPLKIIDTANGQSTHPLMGKEAPDFSLKTVSGKSFNLVGKRGAPLILTFVSSWSPSSLEQILVANKIKNSAFGQIYLVDIQEPMSKISIFQKRGGYSLDFIADSDGTLVEPYNVNFLPMHFVLDRKGVVRKVISGVLNKEELENALLNIAQ